MLAYALADGTDLQFRDDAGKARMLEVWNSGWCLWLAILDVPDPCGIIEFGARLRPVSDRADGSSGFLLITLAAFTFFSFSRNKNRILRSGT